VDTFYKIYGTHPGFRVNHAKGVVAEGSFVATPAAVKFFPVASGEEFRDLLVASAVHPGRLPVPGLVDEDEGH
jgi:hypothetical protein